MTGNAAWLIACRVVADVLNLLLFVLISRKFGPAGTGLYAYGFAIAGFLFSATTLGVEEYAIREYARGVPGQRSRMLQDVLGAQLCVLLIALAVLGVYLLATRPDRATLICTLALTIYQLGNALAATLFVPAMAEQHMIQQAVSFLASRSFAFVLAGALLISGRADLPGALLAFATSGVLIVLLGARSARLHAQPLGARVSHAALRQVGREMWSFASIDLLSQVLARISVVALNLLVSGAAAGVYATGLKLIEAASLPLNFIGAAAYPRLCQSYHTATSEFRKLQSRLLALSTTAAVGIALGMYFIVPRLLVPIFGANYEGTQPFIASMALLALVQAAEIIPGRTLLAADLQVQRAAVIAGAALLCAALNFALVPLWGGEAANISTTGSYAAVCLCYAWLLYSRAARGANAATMLRQRS